MTSPAERRFLPPHAFAVALLAQVPGIILTWPPTPPAWAIATAAAMVLAALGLGGSAVRQFMRNAVGLRPFSPTPTLARGGPYRFTRNPMYLGMVLLASALAVGLGVWWNLAAAAVLAVWLHFNFVLPEEAFLRAQFGDAFERYTREIPRWLGLPRS
jgi:protein-S-isoprenylcysteine O-methyltransferase Ste14